MPALAASSSASSASEAASSTVGSLSNSLKQSSTSSSKDDKVTAGEYRIVEVAEAEQAGQMRVELQYLGGSAGAEAPALTLTLPRAAFEQGRLATGEVVAARHRPYGVEFARADNREAFFLVLEDAWFRELGAQPVVL